MRVLLFDIDGTLIRSDRAGRLALTAALMELFGTAGPLARYEMGGKTDARIVTDILTSIGVPENEIHAQLPVVYELMAKKALEIYPTRDIQPCIGVRPLLAALENVEGVIVALLTGNSYLTAPLKLRAAGIDPAQFLFGVYGSEALDRDQLPAIAMNRATQLTGHVFTGDNTVVIGDTPADIFCARAGKATAVSVAGGWHTVSALAEYKPDYLFEDFADTAVVLAALLNS